MYEIEEQLPGQPIDTEQDDQPDKGCFHFSRFHFKRCFKIVPVKQAHADDTGVDICDGSDNAPAVLVRRGPVKLPARAIAKVGPPLSSCTLQAAANANNADV